MGQIFDPHNPACLQLLNKAVCVWGVFDGVHKGHQYVITEARKASWQLEVPLIAITFNIDPDELFHADTHEKLMTNKQRHEALAEKVDYVLTLPFTRELASLTPLEFLNTLFAIAKPSRIYVGDDFRFGCQASGTVEALQSWGKAYGTEVHGLELKTNEGKAITSTRIRELLSEGNIAEATELLGHPYVLEGTVAHGQGRGENLGFATANVICDKNLYVLKDGVYAAWATVGGIRYKAAVAVGAPSTFTDESTFACEAHLIDFVGDLYDADIEVEFVSRIRDMKKFDSVEELTETVQSNIEWVKNNL